MCEPEGAAATDEYADESEHHPLADDHVAKIRRLCAERHADAEFLGALLNGIPSMTNASATYGIRLENRFRIAFSSRVAVDAVSTPLHCFESLPASVRPVPLV